MARPRGARRFAPGPWQLVALEAVVGAAAYSLAMVLRFVDEGAIPETYALRVIPWAVAAAVLTVAGGELAGQLGKPRSPLAGRPVLPFIVAGAVALVVVLAVNRLLPVWLTLPISVKVVGPLLASAGSAALRIAGARPEVSPDDLLPRRTVHLDVAACGPALRAKRVLITGAAGSIGAELARQVLAVGPAEVGLLDLNETGLFELQAELEPLRGAARVRPVIADVADQRRIGDVFQEWRPQVVFHAAAYKHVPLVEANPEQGFTSNVLGTRAVCQAALAVGSERVVVISTDKAVNPTSVMGLTKRLAELIVVALGRQAEGTVLSAVRFGNVLGSRGSVVPTLLRQIESGGPVTITHRDAHRFFMTIAEAASLVLRSAAFGAAGTIFVLDMGDELRIVDLAVQLVRLKGLRPGRDVAFEYVGLRPGERLHEQLCGDGETLATTDHAYVRRVAAAYAVDGDLLLRGVSDLDGRRRVGGLRPEEYAPALRSLVDASVRPDEPLTSYQPSAVS